MKTKKNPLPASVVRVLSYSVLRKKGGRCVRAIFYYFFYLQYKAALRPGRVPVAWVDHPLDAKIPFEPDRVGVYLDFTAFWIRALGELLRRYGARGVAGAGDFLDTLGELYRFAAQVYTRCLSTTRRPRYFKKLRFVLIHTADPHLMCIPSLHVMIVVRTYTKIRAILRTLGESEDESESEKKWVEALRRRALEITEAILFVKQHSVNCVSAALYAMTRFDPALFPPEEAAVFVQDLFTTTPLEGREHIREMITTRFWAFVEAGASAPSWEAPLLAFLHASPQKAGSPPPHGAGMSS